MNLGYETREDLMRMAFASLDIANQLSKQAKQQRAAAKRLLKQAERM